MTPAIYLAAHGHMSARGSGAQAARAVLQGKVEPGRWRIAGEDYPYFALPVDGTWQQRCDLALSALADALPTTPATNHPYFFASSSFQGGRVEGRFEQFRQDSLPLPDSSGLDEPSRCMGHYARQVCARLGSQVTPWCFSTACTSGIAALNAAALLLRAGVHERARVLATELYNRLSGSGFHSLGLLSRTRPQPFGAGRDGLVLGEAVAALDLSIHRPTQASSCWRLLACETGLDTYSLTGVNPDGSAVARVMARALHCAGLDASQIDLVKVHAAGVGDTDLAEARALLRVFGPRLPALVALKPWIGHTQGASGLVELALLLDSLALGRTPGLPEPYAADPDIAARLQVQPMTLEPRHILLNSIGFGGSVGVVILRRESR